MNLKAFFVLPVLSIVLSFSASAGSHKVSLPGSEAELKTSVIKSFNLEIAQSSEIQIIIGSQTSPSSVRYQPAQIRLIGGVLKISMIIFLNSEETLFVLSPFTFTRSEGGGEISFEGMTHKVSTGSTSPTKQ